MTVGVMALAVPLSSNFAGEFLILAGVFQQGWGWAVVGAGAIVLAAMYMLRLISAVLHREVGPAVSDAALDLRRGELADRRAARRDPARRSRPGRPRSAAASRPGSRRRASAAPRRALGAAPTAAHAGSPGAAT